MGKTLIQARQEAKQRYMRTMSIVAALPVMFVGAAVLYFGHTEQNPVYLFFYVLLGFGLLLLGAQLLISGFPSSSARITGSGALKELASNLSRMHADRGDVSHSRGGAERCPSCGADLISAGKFCGSCGKALAQYRGD